jgi:hypothetical protein
MTNEFSNDPIFMGMLTIILLVVFSIAVVVGRKAFSKDATDTDVVSQYLGYLKAVGLFALVFGVFGQFLDLYGIFDAIERAGDINPQLLYAGLRISSITTIYGIGIFLLAYLFWFMLDYRLRSGNH